MSKTQNPNRLMVCHGRACKLAGKKHPAKDLLQSETNKAKRFCLSCFEADKKEQIEKRKLEHTICRLYKIPTIKQGPSMIQAQIKRFVEKGYTLKNIRMSLEYFYDIKGNSANNSQGIGIVPYVHDEMIEYWKARAARSVNSQHHNKDKVTKVKMPLPKKKFDYKKEKTISMEELANAIKR